VIRAESPDNQASEPRNKAPGRTLIVERVAWKEKELFLFEGQHTK